MRDVRDESLPVAEIAPLDPWWRRPPQRPSFAAALGQIASPAAPKLLCRAVARDGGATAGVGCRPNCCVERAAARTDESAVG
jgi:hypothetical protein